MSSSIPSSGGYADLLRDAALGVTRPRVSVRADLPEVSHHAVYDVLHALIVPSARPKLRDHARDHSPIHLLRKESRA